MALDPITAIVGTVGTIIDKIFPDANQAALAKLELEKLKLNGDLQIVVGEMQLQMAQIEVNREDAKSGNWWQSGWRPAVGWVGAFGFGYAAILEPFARFTATVLFGYGGPFPVLDATVTMQVLFALLGFGAYRAVERIKGKV